MTFNISENQLTNAIFFDIATDAPGTSTVAQARAQARLMLAAPKLLEACRYAYEVLRDVESSDDLMDGVVVSMTNVLESAIQAAEGED